MRVRSALYGTPPFFNVSICFDYGFVIQLTISISNFFSLYFYILSDQASSCGNPFVLTSAVQKTFETVSLAVSQKWPVLLYGPSGSGKTSLISKLAQLNSDKQGNFCLFNYILCLVGNVCSVIIIIVCQFQ